MPSGHLPLWGNHTIRSRLRGHGLGIEGGRISVPYAQSPSLLFPRLARPPHAVHAVSQKNTLDLNAILMQGPASFVTFGPGRVIASLAFPLAGGCVLVPCLGVAPARLTMPRARCFPWLHRRAT